MVLAERGFPRIKCRQNETGMTRDYLPPDSIPRPSAAEGKATAQFTLLHTGVNNVYL